MERDLASNMSTELAIDLLVINSNGITDGNIIDTIGFESLTFIVVSDVIQDGNYSILIKEGNDPSLSDAVDVSVDDLLGSAIVFGVSDQKSSFHVGVNSNKRYYRLSVEAVGITSGGTFVASAILSHAKKNPVIG